MPRRTIFHHGHRESRSLLDFRILGPLEVVVGGRRVAVKPAKARALLALLLLDPGRPVPTDRLIDELWGEAPPASAAVSLRVLPHEFDRKLPPELAVAGNVFVGRQAESEVLVGLWELAAAGSLRAALIAGEPGIGKTRLAAELARLASQARPLVLVLDDLHWAARPTLLMLRRLLRSSDAMRLLVLGTYRDTELDRAHPLAEVLADLRREPVQLERLRLRGLDAYAVGAYVAASHGERLEDDNIEFARTLYESTEGNPFFIGEVLRHLVESGLARQENGRWLAAAEIADDGLPEGVKEVITRRLSRLPEAVNRALAVAAVVGSTFSLPCSNGSTPAVTRTSCSTH